MLNIYYSFVFPYLIIYCIEILGNASSVHLDALIKNTERMC